MDAIQELKHSIPDIKSLSVQAFLYSDIVFYNYEVDTQMYKINQKLLLNNKDYITKSMSSGKQ